jgi:hypothetical protein
MLSWRTSVLLTGALVVGAFPVVAQRDGPREAVDQIFLGMRMASESVLRSVLAPDVRFAILDAFAGYCDLYSLDREAFARTIARYPDFADHLAHISDERQDQAQSAGSSGGMLSG